MQSRVSSGEKNCVKRNGGVNVRILPASLKNDGRMDVAVNSWGSPLALLAIGASPSNANVAPQSHTRLDEAYAEVN